MQGLWHSQPVSCCSVSFDEETRRGEVTHLRPPSTSGTVISQLLSPHMLPVFQGPTTFHQHPLFPIDAGRDEQVERVGVGQESRISNVLSVHLQLKLKSPLTQQDINSPG